MGDSQPAWSIADFDIFPRDSFLFLFFKISCIMGIENFNCDYLDSRDLQE